MEEEESAGLGLHWHVITGIRGYMPDTNSVYTDKDSAVEGAAFYVEDLQEYCESYNESDPDLDPSEQMYLSGTSEEGWVETEGGRYHISRYIEVSECTDTSCNLEDEYW